MEPNEINNDYIYFDELNIYDTFSLFFQEEPILYMKVPETMCLLYGVKFKFNAVDYYGKVCRVHGDEIVEICNFEIGEE